MARRRPWCNRALCTHERIEQKGSQLWVRSRLIDIGFWILLMTLCGFASAMVALFDAALSPSQQFAKDDPLAPGFWEVTFPIMGIVVLVSAALFAIGTLIRWLGVKRLKGLLIPVRCQRCPKCFYDLSARSRTDDICPECGSYTPRRECVRLWCKLLRSRI